MSSLSLKYNLDPICPYCGTEQSDAWELRLEKDGDEKEIDCISCGLPFTVKLDLTVQYSTSPLKEKVLAICKDEGIEIPQSLAGA